MRSPCSSWRWPPAPSPTSSASYSTSIARSAATRWACSACSAGSSPGTAPTSSSKRWEPEMGEGLRGCQPGTRWGKVLAVSRRELQPISIRREVPVALKLRPLADRVVVKPLEREEMTKSGIGLPETANEKPHEGTVEAIGSGRYNEQSGKRVELDVKVGDRVMYAKYAGSEVKIDEVEYLILSEKDILAVVASNGSK